MDFKHVYIGRIAGEEIPWTFRFPDTHRYLRKYIKDEKREISSRMVSVSKLEYSDWEKFGNKVDAFGEFCLLCQQTSDYLLAYDCCIFHAAAISYADRSWLIAAGSGVGKSTLCGKLIEIYPMDIQVINGDKPALQNDGRNGIMVHPSPWNGKEGWKGAEAAPLGGVFLLQRGSETGILPAKETEAVFHIFMNIFQSYTKEDTLRTAGRMTEDIIKTTPVWMLTSYGVQETAELVHKVMHNTMEGKYEL